MLQKNQLVRHTIQQLKGKIEELKSVTLEREERNHRNEQNLEQLGRPYSGGKAHLDKKMAEFDKVQRDHLELMARSKVLQRAVNSPELTSIEIRNEAMAIREVLRQSVPAQIAFPGLNAEVGELERLKRAYSELRKIKDAQEVEMNDLKRKLEEECERSRSLEAKLLKLDSSTSGLENTIEVYAERELSAKARFVERERTLNARMEVQIELIRTCWGPSEKNGGIRCRKCMNLDASTKIKNETAKQGKPLISVEVKLNRKK